MGMQKVQYQDSFQNFKKNFLTHFLVVATCLFGLSFVIILPDAIGAELLMQALVDIGQLLR